MESEEIEGEEREGRREDRDNKSWRECTVKKGWWCGQETVWWIYLNSKKGQESDLESLLHAEIP